MGKDHCIYPQVILNSKINALGTVLKFILPFPFGPIFVRPKSYQCQAIAIDKLDPRSFTKSLRESNGIDQEQNEPSGHQATNSGQTCSKPITTLIRSLDH